MQNNIREELYQDQGRPVTLKSNPDTKPTNASTEWKPHLFLEEVSNDTETEH